MEIIHRFWNTDLIFTFSRFDGLVGPRTTSSLWTRCYFSRRRVKTKRKLHFDTKMRQGTKAIRVNLHTPCQSEICRLLPWDLLENAKEVDAVFVAFRKENGTLSSSAGTVSFCLLLSSSFMLRRQNDCSSVGFWTMQTCVCTRVYANLRFNASFKSDCTKVSLCHCLYSKCARFVPAFPFFIVLQNVICFARKVFTVIHVRCAFSVILLSFDFAIASHWMQNNWWISC